MSELFDKARELLKVEDVAEKLGVKLREQGRELRGPCPLCSAGASTGTVFQIKPDKQTWRCFACEKYGDVVDLYAEANRLSVAEAAREITGDVRRDLAARPTPPRPRPEDDGARERRILDLALGMWRDGRDFAGSLGERYLLARKIAPEIVEQIGGLRFHANAPHSWDTASRTWNRAPAIVAKAMSGGAWPGGVHVTYLTPDGLAKSSLSPAKRMWGPQVEITGHGPRRCGAILIDPDDGLDRAARGATPRDASTCGGRGATRPRRRSSCFRLRRIFWSRRRGRLSRSTAICRRSRSRGAPGAA